MLYMYMIKKAINEQYDFFKIAMNDEDTKNGGQS